MTKHSPWLASRIVHAVQPNGKQIQITLRIGHPYEVSPEEWTCPVALEGLQERTCNVRGIDAWQALQLAQGLQAQLLSYFIEDGGKLFCDEPPQPMELRELFPEVPPQLRGAPEQLSNN